MRSQKSAPIAILIDLYVQASGELFSAYGLKPQAPGEEAARRNPDEMRYVSILSATGDDIRLLSTLNVDETMLANIHPSASGRLSQRQLEDWCSELNNQLVGRVKNKLLRFGCEIMTGLPSLVTGTDLTTVSPPDLDFREYFFASAQGRLESTLAMLLSPRLELAESRRSEEEAIMFEGALRLFDASQERAR